MRSQCHYFRGFFTGVEVGGKLRWITHQPLLKDRPPKSTDSKRLFLERLWHEVDAVLAKDGKSLRKRKFSRLESWRFVIACNDFCVLASKQDEIEAQIARIERAIMDTLDLNEFSVFDAKEDELKSQLKRIEATIARTVEDLAQLLK